MVPSWSPTPARRNPNSGIPNIAYRMQKIFPPSVLGAMLPYPRGKNGDRGGYIDLQYAGKKAVKQLEKKLVRHSTLYVKFIAGIGVVY